MPYNVPYHTLMYAEAWTSGEKSRELSTAFRNYGDVWVERIPLLAESSQRRGATPAAPTRWLRGILLTAQPPLLCEEARRGILR